MKSEIKGIFHVDLTLLSQEEGYLLPSSSSPWSFGYPQSAQLLFNPSEATPKTFDVLASDLVEAFVD